MRVWMMSRVQTEIKLWLHSILSGAEDSEASGQSFLINNNTISNNNLSMHLCMFPIINLTQIFPGVS